MMKNQPVTNKFHANLMTAPGRGFTLIELLAVISIISLLMAILMPALGKARKTANITDEMANQKSIVASLTNYSLLENDGMFPFLDPLGEAGLFGGYRKSQLTATGPTADVMSHTDPVGLGFLYVGDYLSDGAVLGSKGHSLFQPGMMADYLPGGVGPRFCAYMINGIDFEATDSNLHPIWEKNHPADPVLVSNSAANSDSALLSAFYDALLGHAWEYTDSVITYTDGHAIRAQNTPDDIDNAPLVQRFTHRTTPITQKQVFINARALVTD